MTKTAAIKQAISESDLYKFGGWVLKTIDSDCNAYRESLVFDYWTGLAQLTNWRFNRVCELLGYVHDYGDYQLSKYAYDARFDYGTLRQRVNRAVALENS